MSLTPATNRQVPDHSILDYYNKQVYLGNSYSYGFNGAIASTAEIPLFLLSNPLVPGSSFPSGYVSLFLTFSQLAIITASQSAIVRAYLSPTVTSTGTASVPLNRRPGSPHTSIAGLYLSPTLSENGNLIDLLSASPGFAAYSNQMLIMDPGQSLLLTVQASANPTIIGAGLSWYEL